MTHDERMHQLLYSNEGRVEQCERICRLEELVRDMYKAFQRVFPDGHRLDFEMDMRELGVEV